MKKNKLKYVLIPAFAAAALFPVLADDNQAKANDDKSVTPSTVNNTVSTSEKSASVPSTDNITETSPATPTNTVDSAKTTPVNNSETINSASVENNKTVK